MKTDYELAAIAVGQAGFLSRQQIDEQGMSATAIRRRVANGSLLVVRKGLYRVPGIGGDQRAHLRAALAILPRPTVSHEAAAEFHRIPYVKRGKAVVTVHSRTTHEFPGVEVHRSLDLIDGHRQEAESMWWTTVARTLVDCAAVIHPKALALALDESLAAQLVTIDAVHDVFTQVARRGRIGSAAMRKLLGDRVGSDMVTATQIERVGMRLFENGGVPRPKWQYPAPWNHDESIDFAWPHVMVGCECDSRRWHTRVNDFQVDRIRDNAALLHNWRILRFTWEDFTKRPTMVLEHVRSAIGC